MEVTLNGNNKTFSLSGITFGELLTIYRLCRGNKEFGLAHDIMIFIRNSGYIEMDLL